LPRTPSIRSLALATITLMAALAAACLLAASASAQNTNGRYDNVSWATTSIQGQIVLTPQGMVQVAVCSYPANALPCTNTVTLYSTPTTSSPSANPFVSDPQGNFGFFAPPGYYQYTATNTTTGQSYGPYSIVIATGAGTVKRVGIS
jgi:hypothetical protein